MTTETATSNKAISTALLKAQREFAPALKTATNPHFRSKYVSLDGCIEAVIDALNNNGIFMTQRTHESDTGIKIETLFLHESGEYMSGGILHVPAPKQDPQGYGSALTYARRYSLMAACGIAPEDDDGNEGDGNENNGEEEQGSDENGEECYEGMEIINEDSIDISRMLQK